MALAVRPHTAKHALDIDDRAEGLDLVGRHKAHVIDADGLETAVVRLQPLPAFRGGGDCMPPVTFMPIDWPRLGLDIFEKVDRIGLEERDIRIGVERVEVAGRVPGRTRCEH